MLELGWDKMSVEFLAESPEDLAALHRELRGVAGLQVTEISVGVPGDLGDTAAFLTVACASGGAVTVLLQAVRSVVISLRRGASLKFRRPNGAEVEINAANADEVLAILRELADGS